MRRLVHEGGHRRQVHERGGRAHEGREPVAGERAVGHLRGVGERDQRAAHERAKPQRDRLGGRPA